MKQESLLWFIRMMEFTQDTEERMKLLNLAYDEGVADGMRQTLAKLSPQI